MAKKPTTPTTEEVKQMIEVGTGGKMGEVAKAVFKEQFAEVKKEGPRPASPLLE